MSLDMLDGRLSVAGLADLVTHAAKVLRKGRALVLRVIGEEDPGTNLPRFPDVGRIRIHGDNYVRSGAGQSARKIHYFDAVWRILDSGARTDTIPSTI